MSPAGTAVTSLVEQIVSTIHPFKVVLFGSTARGDASADSDIELNCKHIANARMLKKIYSVCAAAGYICPLVCTPELMEGDGIKTRII